MSTHTAQTQLQLIGKLILSGDLHCETGLHIGAGKGSLEIGGADNPVVKDAFGLPYIPGSSLRGRVRSLLENALGLTTPAELVYLSKRRGQEVRIHQSDRPDDEICLLFGRAAGRLDRVSQESAPSEEGGEKKESRERGNTGPARLTIYDAPLDSESITAQMRENLDDEITEVKSENAIDRITAQANPRTLERVPAGARFKVRAVLDILCEEDKALAARVIEGLRLLEDDALGGGGSRGSGRVRFANLKLVWRNRAFYSSGGDEAELAAGSDLAGVQKLTADGFADKLA